MGLKDKKLSIEKKFSGSCATVSFYNSNRIHSYLRYKNPNDFEKSFTLAKAA